MFAGTESFNRRSSIRENEMAEAQYIKTAEMRAAKIVPVQGTLRSGNGPDLRAVALEKDRAAPSEELRMRPCL